MKIGGVYILSRRSIARMIATITAALMSLYAAVSAQAQNTVRRIHDAAIALHMLDRQMMGGVTRTVVPEIMYSEYKALYLELRKDKKPPGGWAAEWGRGGVRGAPALPCGRDGARPSLAGAATKADLRAAVKHRGRRGSGLKGKRTERMVEQLAEFKAWLTNTPINERHPARTIGARARQFWRFHQKTFDRDLSRIGEKRGFCNEKTLASAFRNSKV